MKSVSEPENQRNLRPAAVYCPCNSRPRMPPPDAAKSRLAYIDWMRGLACVLMFQTHCYDSWLSPRPARAAFSCTRSWAEPSPRRCFCFSPESRSPWSRKNCARKISRRRRLPARTIRRGAEIFGFGLLFRLQEFVVAWGWAPKSDLLRVDILNTIGLSMMLMGIVCWLVLAVRRGPGTRLALVLTAAGTALLISLLSPLLWTTWRPDWLPWPLESYVNGVHNLGTPQAGLFPVFPWTAFAFAGLAAGFILQSSWAREQGPRAFFSLGLAGGVLIVFARWLDAQPRQLYSTYDYWHTSPSFFLIRVGMLLVILTASYAWCGWGAGQWGFSPLILLGQASLLVYWVHIEFVYGRVSILPKHMMGIGGATVGLMIISLAMLALAFIRIKMKGRGADLLAWLRRTPART